MKNKLEKIMLFYSGKESQLDKFDKLIAKENKKK